MGDNNTAHDFSIQNHITFKPPKASPRAVCIARLTIENPLKLNEGALRLKGLYKRSVPSHPLVTVITVVRDRVDTIEQCIHSVLTQSYCNIEYIVIDGASRDGTVEKIQQYTELIDYFVSEPDGGIYDAMNKGLGLANGDYVLFLNSDDWYPPQAVQRLVDYAIAHDADVTHADIFRVSRKGFILGRLNGWLNDSLYTTDMPLRHETMLVKKQIYNTFGGYDTDFNIIADYDFVIRLYINGCSFTHVPEPLLYFRITGCSSTRLDERIAERKKLFKRIFPFLETSDAASLAQGLSPARRAFMREKYKNSSQRFVRSVVCNDAYSSIRASNIASFLYKTKLLPWSFIDFARKSYQCMKVIKYMIVR